MNKESNININMDEAILLRYFSGTLEKEFTTSSGL